MDCGPTRRKAFIYSVVGTLASLDADATASLQVLPDALNPVDANFEIEKILKPDRKNDGSVPATACSGGRRGGLRVSDAGDA